jgi:signal transduction histidine kinase
VAVRDRGEGIGPEEQSRLFQRFRRAGGEGRGRRISGTGIGLFVCRALVEAHGGRIWVDSQVGEGSTFRFTVPVYQGQDRREAADGDPPGA